MTSSRMYGPSVQNQFNLAGRRLGLDLAGLFEDDENGSSQFGDLVPGMRVTSTARGRGHGLTMRPQQRDAVTTEFSLTPEAKGGSSSSSSSSSVTLPGGPPKEIEKEPEIELKQYVGNVGGVGVEDIGESGFGMKDYDAAIDAGYDPESIKDWVKSNRYNLENIGPGAREVLGMQDYVNLKPGKFDYSQYGESGFGMKDVEALEARGVSEEDMRILAQQAPRVGAEAAKRFGISSKTEGQARKAPAPVEYNRPSGPSATPVTGYGLGKGDGSGFNYAAFGGSGFGMKDVAALQSRGASQADMKRIAQGASNIGPEARKLLGL